MPSGLTTDITNGSIDYTRHSQMFLSSTVPSSAWYVTFFKRVESNCRVLTSIMRVVRTIVMPLSKCLRLILRKKKGRGYSPVGANT